MLDVGPFGMATVVARRGIHFRGGVLVEQKEAYTKDIRGDALPEPSYDMDSRSIGKQNGGQVPLLVRCHSQKDHGAIIRGKY